MKTLVIGAGKMTEALFEGLHGQVDLSNYYFFSPSGVSARALASKVQGQFLEKLSDLKDPSFVWIGCKPQQLKDLSQEVLGLYPEATFISMLAAVPESKQKESLGAKALVRIMPNLSVKFRKGITLMSSVSGVGKLPELKDLFSMLGHVEVLSEKELEELTLLTGSGPAFFYEFTKSLAQSFTSLDDETREKLARLVLQGAGLSSLMSPESMSTMINGVTSKGGVTIAVLEDWRKNNLSGVIQKGMEAGAKRAFEIKTLLS